MQVQAERWKSLSPEERETFFEAIARHRRASWRVTVACAVAVVVLTVVVAILMAPLLYGLLGLSLDLVNFFTPAPDLLGFLFRLIDPLFESKQVTTAMFVRVGAVAALPGLALMGLATFGLRRIWMTSPLFDAGDVPGRAPDRTVLEEARLANVVEEMAIAAGISVPRVVIVPGGANAAACGRDSEHVTLLVGESLPRSLNREQLEGALAHLVASVADGDMTIGLRVTTTLVLFGLIARLGVSFTDSGGFWQTAKLWRVFVAPTSSGTASLLGTLADPFHDDARADARTRAAAQRSDLTWREWALMPLMGPVWLTGFLSGLVTQFLLEPLVAAAWRQRKYMADAAAVQLTRDPDGLAGSLTVVGSRPLGIVQWTAHLAVAPDPSGQSGPFGRSIVPIFPSAEKRMKALIRLGAHVTLGPRKPGLPLVAKLVIGALLSVAGALMCVVVYLLVILSTAMSGFFTIMPVAALHVLLRWLAGR